LANLRSESEWRVRLQLLLFVLLLTVGVGLILSSELLFSPRVAIEEGQAANEDIAAPRGIEFESAILTDLERRDALKNVTDVYDPLDRQVGREQVYLAQQILDFIDSVRADPYATLAYQRYSLESVESADLSPKVISNTLRLSDVAWKAVQLETRQVLAQVMRNEIKAGQEDLYRRSVRALIDFDLNEAQTAIVNEIASALVKSNRAHNAQATEAARQAAIESVQPKIVVLKENEIIVRSGEIVTSEHLEALDNLGLLNPQVDWLTVNGTFLFAFLLAVSTLVYLWSNEPAFVAKAHHLLLFLLLLILFASLAKWGSSQPVSQAYLVPLAALGMLVTVLFNVRLGLVAHVLICLVVGYMTRGQLDLFLYNLMGGLMGMFALRRAYSIKAFVWAGSYVTLVNSAAVVTFALLGGDLNTLRLGQWILASIVNGAFSAILTLGGYYLLGMVFDITSTPQLLDLARPTHPLIGFSWRLQGPTTTALWSAIWVNKLLRPSARMPSWPA